MNAPVFLPNVARLACHMPGLGSLAWLTLAGWLALAPGARAETMPYITQLVPNAVKVGEGRLDVFVWNFYNVSLYAPHGKWQVHQPCALRFHYLRAFSGEELASSVVDRMRRYQKVDELQLAAWYTKLLEFFPNVGPNDELVVVANSRMETLFYYRGAKARELTMLGKLLDSQFTTSYLSVWLGDRVEYPELRAKLLGILSG